MSSKDKKIVTICTIIVVILLGILILSLLRENNCDKINDNNPSTIIDENNQANIENNNKECDYSYFDGENDYTFNLNCPIVNVNINDNIKMIFNGEKEEESEDLYMYTMQIIVDGINVETDIFNNSNNKVIYSEAYAASFRIIKIDDLYFLVSSIAKQNDGDYVVVLKNGLVLYTYEDVQFNINKETKIIEISDCSSNNLDENCSVIQYRIENNDLMRFN